MPKSESPVRLLAEYAAGMQGAEQDSSWSMFDVLEEPHLTLPRVSWGGFFEVREDEGRHFAHMPVLKNSLAAHQREHPQIRNSNWAERDGHVYMEVPLDGKIPLDFLKSLIDDAHTLVWNKLDEDARQLISLADGPYDERKFIDRLIDIHDLQNRRKAIHQLARHAILLRTRETSERLILPAATKIGGRPDLPAKTEWPAYSDGRPLAFLGQVNLQGLGMDTEGWPADGLLSIFSVWGWMDPEEGSDPETPADVTEDNQEENGWTILIHTPPGTPLERKQTPQGVNAFKAAAVDPAPILSLPNHRAEPPVRALKLSDEEFDRFDQMQSDFHSLQMRHWLKSFSHCSHHQLAGYALFQQAFPPEVLEKKLAMVLQISTDGNTGMSWGDGGELTFYADAQALHKGQFQRVWGTCQGG